MDVPASSTGELAAGLGNPFLELLGAQQVAWSHGYSEFELALRPALLNRQGLLQGGVLSTLLDVACGYAGLHTAPGQPMRHGHTVSLTLQYLNKAAHGVVRAKGFLVQEGRSLYFARGEAWLDGHLLLATAQATFKVSRRAG